MNDKPPEFVKPPPEFVCGDSPPDDPELVQIVESEFSKELEKHFAQPTQIRTAKRPVPNSRGSTFQYFVIIGPTNKRAAEVISDTTQHVQSMAATNRQLRFEADAKILKIKEELNAEYHDRQTEAVEEFERLVRDTEHEHEKRYNRLAGRRDREKQIVALLIGPQLIPLLNKTEYFDKPNYFTPVIDDIDDTQLRLTTDNIEHPEAEPIAFWASKKKLKDIIPPPFRTTLYTFHPNIIYWLDKYHIYTTTKRASGAEHLINMQMLYAIINE